MTDKAQAIQWTGKNRESLERFIGAPKMEFFENGDMVLIADHFGIMKLCIGEWILKADGVLCGMADEDFKKYFKEY